MFEIILTVHVLLAIGLIGVILVQRSEGGALGIGGGGGAGGGMGGFMTGRGTANLLTRTTAILAAAFICTSLALAVLSGGGRTTSESILDTPGTGGTGLPLPALPSTDGDPLLPQVPLGEQ